MSWIVEFFTWLLNCCRRAVAKIMTVPGMVITFLGSLVALVFNFILDLPFFQALISGLETLVSSGQEIMSSDIISSPFAQTVLYTVNIKSFFLASSTTLAATFGAIAYMTISLLVVILPLIIAVFVARAILKVVSVASGGILSP